MRIFLSAQLLAILLSGCVSGVPSYVMYSSDIIVSIPGSPHFSFTAEVARQDERMFFITMHSEQMNAAGFYAFCIAAHVAGKAGYSRYVLGAKDPKEKTIGRYTLTFPTLVLNPTEKPETVGPAGYTWGPVMELSNPIFRDSCSKMMQQGYLW